MSASTIKLRRSSVAGNKPTTDQLALGEVAINTHDGKMFFKRDKNGELSIVELGGSAIAENVFYVSKSGDDSNDGTSLDRAFLTIDKALEMTAQRRADAGLDSDGAEGSILESKTIRDLQYYIDGAKYDITLGTKFNQVFQGRAGFYTKGKDEVISSLEWTKAKFANTISTTLSTGEDAPLGLLALRQTANLAAKQRSDAYWDELTEIIDSGRDNADTLDSSAYPNTNLATRGYYKTSTIEDDATRSRDLLLANKLFLAEEVSQYIEKQVADAPNWYNFTYNESKCNRDTKLLVDAVRYDTLFGTNIRSVSAAIRYYNGTANTVLNNQKTQTVQSFTKAKEFTSLNLTDAGTITTAEALWDEIIEIVDSGSADIDAGSGVADAYNYATPIGSATFPTNRDSDFGHAANQLYVNKLHIQEEIIGWILKQVTDQTAPFTSSFSYDSVSCKRDVGLVLDAVIYDTIYGGNLQSYDAAIAYYVGAQAQYGDGEKEETIAALQRLKDVVSDVVLANNITESQDPSYYTGSQLTNANAGDSAAAIFAAARIEDIIYYLQQDGVNKPTKSYPDTTWATATLQSEFALLGDSAQQSIADSTVGWISDQISLADGFFNYNYDSVRQSKSQRDTRFTLEALTYDATYTGNAASYDNASFFYNNGPQIPETDRLVCAAAFDRLSTIVGNILAGDSVELSDSSGAYTYTQQFSGASQYPSTSKITELSGLISMASDVIEGGTSYLPSSKITPDLNTSEIQFDSASLDSGTVDYKAIFSLIEQEDSDILNSTTTGTNNEGVITYLDRVYPELFGIGDRYQDILDPPEIASTIYVKTGEYTINNPVEIPKNVSLIGDNLKNTSIRPKNKTSDMFYVNNNCYVAEFTFRDHLQPAAVICWDPTGTPDTNIIVNSPYIRNCTSITGPDLTRNDDGTYVYPDSAGDLFTPAAGGDGIRNDGAHAGGIRSIVVDSFTQINQGGKGVYLKNRGYCQLVSVFTVYCDVGFLAENGGFASITNSNSSFGNTALKAVGVSNPLYSCNVDSDQDRLDNIITLKNMDRLPNISDAVFFGSIVPTDGTLSTDSDFFYTVDSASYDSATGTGSIKLLENVEVDIPNNSSVRFFQRSALSSSGHTFEWIGTGTDVRTAFPYRGGVPNQADEVIQDSNRGGLCFVTSTDQKGDFRVGEGFLIQRSTGTIEGEAFDRSLFARITPFSLALED